MKKLIVALMVLSTLASCGKDNKVASASTSTSPATSTTSATNGISVDDVAGKDLGRRIDNSSTEFGLTYIPYFYMTIGQMVYKGQNVIYKFTKQTQMTNSDCETKWIFTLCSSSSSSSYSNVQVSRTVNGNDVTHATKSAELKAYINNRHALYPITVSGTTYSIRTKDNKVITIDRSLPIQGNPVAIRDLSANTTEYLFRYEIQ